MAGAYQLTQPSAGLSAIPPDEQLLHRCRTGDREALSRVYALHSALVFRCAYSMLGHYEDARDASQETFVKAFQALDGFQGHCSLRTWLLRICANLCRDRSRKRIRRKEVSLEEFADDSLANDRGFRSKSADPHEDAERSEKAAAVRAALSDLPESHREIIYLRDVEELTVEEVVEILGCSRANVNVKLFRARKRLREKLAARLSAGDHGYE
jgi:RNA polymerase sigma-70 factor (ECF subfamily)